MSYLLVSLPAQQSWHYHAYQQNYVLLLVKCVLYKELASLLFLCMLWSIIYYCVMYCVILVSTGKAPALWATETWTCVHFSQIQIHPFWSGLLPGWLTALRPLSCISDYFCSHCPNTLGRYLWVDVKQQVKYVNYLCCITFRLFTGNVNATDLHSNITRHICPGCFTHFF